MTARTATEVENAPNRALRKSFEAGLEDRDFAGVVLALVESVVRLGVERTGNGSVRSNSDGVASIPFERNDRLRRPSSAIALRECGCTT